MIAMYLAGVVYLVWRQINHMVEEEDMIVMIDNKGKTDLKRLNKVLKDEKKVFTWKTNIRK